MTLGRREGGRSVSPFDVEQSHAIQTAGDLSEAEMWEWGD